MRPTQYSAVIECRVYTMSRQVRKTHESHWQRRLPRTVEGLENRLMLAGNLVDGPDPNLVYDPISGSVSVVFDERTEFSGLRLSNVSNEFRPEEYSNSLGLEDPETNDVRIEGSRLPRFFEGRMQLGAIFPAGISSKSTLFELLDQADYTPVVQGGTGELDLFMQITVTTPRDVVDGDTESTDSLISDPGDDGLVSLREAVVASNASLGTDIVGFSASLNGEDVLLEIQGTGGDLEGDLDITESIFIDGNGRESTVINAAGMGDRIFDVFAPAKLHLSSLTITGGGSVGLDGGAIRTGGGPFPSVPMLHVWDAIISGNEASRGGAIYFGGDFGSSQFSIFASELSDNFAVTSGGAIHVESGSVFIGESVVSNNRALDPMDVPSRGGGIFNGFSGETSIEYSTVSDNVAREGGGVANAGAMRVDTSTLSQNTAFRGGGAISVVSDSSFLNVTSSTITRNAATSGGGVDNGVMGTTDFLNTIIANNFASVHGPDVSGTVASQGNNLLGSTESNSGFDHPTDVLNQDPLLGPLRDNGGRTLTHALSPNSPAIDAGSEGGEFESDQRFFSRLQDGDGVDGPARDIGAFELQFLGSSIYGFKFEDIDGDGIYEPGDSNADVPFDTANFPVEIELSGDVDGDGDTDEIRQLVDPSGRYSFHGLYPGAYTIREVTENQPHGIMQSTDTNPRALEVGKGQALVWSEGVVFFDPNGPLTEKNVGDVLVFGNVVKGSIRGLKFEDIDGDGVFDSEIDARMEGVTFMLSGIDGRGNIVDQEAATDANGELHFEDLWPGSYTVTEVVPQGSIASTPTSSSHTLESGDELVAFPGQSMLQSGDPQEEIVIGSDLQFGNLVIGSINGLKFEDLNGDGVFDSQSEQLMSNVTFTLTGTDGKGNSVDRTTLTDANGEFWFEDLLPGDYTLAEIVPPGSKASTNAAFSFSLSSGEAYVAIAGQAMSPPSDARVEVVIGADLQFGNYVPGSIHGLKFEDVDGNGVFDPSVDRRMSDVSFALAGIDGQGNRVDRTVITDVVGEFSFFDLLPGEYTVNELVPSESIPTTPDSFSTTLFSGDALVALAGQAMLDDGDPAEETVVGAELQFGNLLSGAIHGLNFEDVDANGIFDRDIDKRLGGTTFTLTGIDSQGVSVTRSELTNPDGTFAFEGLLPGSYTVTENAQSGFITSTPTSFSTDVSSGDVFVAISGQAELEADDPRQQIVSGAELQFGVAIPGSIHGIKFEDVDGDGVFDSEVDRRIAGATFTLTGIDGLGNEINESSDSDVNGEFKFTGLIPSVAGAGLGTGYQVTEEVSPGSEDSIDFLYSSDLFSREALVAEAGQAALAPDTPQEEVVVGNALMSGTALRGSIEGMNYEDLDADSIYNPDVDLPLTGTTFTLTGTDSQGHFVNKTAITDEDGLFSFASLAPGIYSVSETVPAGFDLTTEGSIVVTLNSQGLSHSEQPDFDAGPLMFGNTIRGAIHGISFEDRDADGTFTPEVDERLVGITFTLTGTDGMGREVNQSFVTDNNGEFRFTDLLPSVARAGSGTGYRIVQTVPDGFESTTETSFSDDLFSGQSLVAEAGQARLSSDAIQTELILAPKSASIASRLTFGATVRGSIHGLVFDDRNGNGVFDSQIEVGLPNATVTLSGIDGQGNDAGELAPVKTNEYGRFWFPDLLPSIAGAGHGTGYTITREQKAGHFNTTALTFNTDLFSRQALVAVTDDAMLDESSLEIEQPAVTNLRYGGYFGSSTGTIAGFVAVGDLDDDGFDDLVVANDYHDPVNWKSSFSLLFSNGDGEFTSPARRDLPGTAARPQSVFIGDLDGDDDLDLAVASIGDPSRPSPTSNAVLVYFNNGRGRNTLFSDGPDQVLLGGQAANSCHSPRDAAGDGRCDGPIHVTFADLNSDNNLDLISANSRSNNIAVVLASGPGEFTASAPSLIPVGRSPVVVRAGNINADNFVDLAVINQGSRNVSILLGRGNGTFDIGVPTNGLNRPSDLILQDFNNDQIKDMAVANFGTNQIRILRGRGDGTFERASQLTTAAGPKSLATGDLDRDGDLDLAVASAKDGAVSLLRNDGDFAFSMVLEFDVPSSKNLHSSAGESPQSIAIGEFDEQSDSLAPNDFAVAHLAYGITTSFNGLPPLGANSLVLASDTGTPSDFQVRPVDVNRDGFISPADALQVINHLVQHGAREIPIESVHYPEDVSGDRYVSAIDALMVINHLLEVRDDDIGAVPVLTKDRLDATVAAAVHIWRTSDITTQQSERLGQIRIRMANLPGRQLGFTAGTVVTIDDDAAGRGWYAPPVPFDHTTSNTASVFSTNSSSFAERVDLLSAVLHELGHVMGLPESSLTGDVMLPELPPGTRRLPVSAMD